jgi:hypothetical protein
MQANLPGLLTLFMKIRIIRLISLANIMLTNQFLSNTMAFYKQEHTLSHLCTTLTRCAWEADAWPLDLAHSAKVTGDKDLELSASLLSDISFILSSLENYFQKSDDRQH